MLTPKTNLKLGLKPKMSCSLFHYCFICKFF